MNNSESREKCFIERDVLIQKLDSLFKIDTLWKDIVDPSARWTPSMYESFDWKNFFNPNYIAGYNGLMLSGSEKIEKVYSICFWSPKVLEQILSQEEDNIMIFAHHHFDFESSGTNPFLGVRQNLLLELRKRNITMYYAHAPANCSESLGTNMGIIESLNATVVDSFSPYGKGMAGKIIDLPSGVSGEELLKRFEDLFQVKPNSLNLKSKETYQRLAIVAGAGYNIEDFKSAERLGAELYLTGEYLPHTDSDYARSKLPSLKSYIDSSKMAFVEVSHCASEELWLHKQMVPWFENLGLKAEFIRNPEPWR